MIDIILYHDNLKETLDLLWKLGWEKAIVLFEVRKIEDLERFRKIDLGEKVYPGILIKSENKKEIKEIAVEAYYNKDYFIDFIVYEISNTELIPYVSRLRFLNAICKFEFDPRKDFLTHKRSGINHVIAKRLKENEIAYLIPLSYIDSNLHVILGRILQNIKLQRKYKFDIIVSSFAKNINELKSIISVDAFYKLFNIGDKEYLFRTIIKQIEKTRRAKSPWVFTKGFEIVRFPYEDFED